MLALALAFSVVLVASSPLVEADVHLREGKLDEVLFALEGKKFEGRDVGTAATLLAAAGQRSLAEGDSILALQFAQMALSHDGTNVVALEVAARTALTQQVFGDAEAYADRWLATAPESTSALLFRADLAVRAGEWGRAAALTENLEPTRLGAAERAELERLQRRAKHELADRSSAMSQLETLELALTHSQERAAETPSAVRSASGRDEGIIVYGTSWCGYCKKANAYLKKRGLKFTEKDIEKDPDAAKELGEKATAQRVRPGGVPVIDVKGTLVLGFDQQRLDTLLR